jgi:hypothetical protein
MAVRSSVPGRLLGRKRGTWKTEEGCEERGKRTKEKSLMLKQLINVNDTKSMFIFQSFLPILIELSKYVAKRNCFHLIFPFCHLQSL